MDADLAMTTLLVLLPAAVNEDSLAMSGTLVKALKSSPAGGAEAKGSEFPKGSSNPAPETTSVRLGERPLLLLLLWAANPPPPIGGDGAWKG